MDRQACLTHQLPDVQYALEAGGTVIAPAMLVWLQRAIKFGQPRQENETLQSHRRDLSNRLEAILAPEPDRAHGKRLRMRYADCRDRLLGSVTAREEPFTHNESERRLCSDFRNLANGLRS